MRWCVFECCCQAAWHVRGNLNITICFYYVNPFRHLRSMATGCGCDLLRYGLRSAAFPSNCPFHHAAHLRNLLRQIRRAAWPPSRTLCRWRSARCADADGLLRVAGAQCGAHGIGRHRLRCQHGDQWASAAAQTRRGLGALGYSGHERRRHQGRDHHALAQRSRRHVLRFPECAVSSAGQGNAVCDGPSHEAQYFSAAV